MQGQAQTQASLWARQSAAAGLRARPTTSPLVGPRQPLPSRARSRPPARLPRRPTLYVCPVRQWCVRLQRKATGSRSALLAALMSSLMRMQFLRPARGRRRGYRPTARAAVRMGAGRWACPGSACCCCQGRPPIWRRPPCRRRAPGARTTTRYRLSTPACRLTLLARRKHLAPQAQVLLHAAPAAARLHAVHALLAHLLHRRVVRVHVPCGEGEGEGTMAGSAALQLHLLHRRVVRVRVACDGGVQVRQAKQARREQHSAAPAHPRAPAPGPARPIRPRRGARARMERSPQPLSCFPATPLHQAPPPRARHAPARIRRSPQSLSCGK